MSGAGISVLADVLMGVLHGATLLASSCGALLPVLAYAIPGDSGRRLAACMRPIRCAGRVSAIRLHVDGYPS
eukprot:1148898-Pelagomonas_calceolata.AAC.6